MIICNNNNNHYKIDDNNYDFFAIDTESFEHFLHLEIVPLLYTNIVVYFLPVPKVQLEQKWGFITNKMSFIWQKFQRMERLIDLQKELLNLIQLMVRV